LADLSRRRRSRRYRDSQFGQPAPIHSNNKRRARKVDDVIDGKKARADASLHRFGKQI
jgi:hypothetical protein